MIMTLRSRLRGNAFRIGMGILLIIIAIMWLAPQMPSVARGLADEWIIDINGSKISFYDFRRKYIVADQQLQMIRRQYGPYADYLLQSQGMPTDPQVIALNDVTAEELLNQAAKALHIDVSPAYISQKLSDKRFVSNSPIGHILPPDLIGANGAIDKTMLRMYLQRLNMTGQQFEEYIEKALERFVTTELIGISIHIPEFQMKNAYQHRFAKKKFSVLQWTLDNMVAQEKKTPLSEDQLQQFYTEQTARHKRYWVPEKRSGFTWECSADSYGIVITDEEAQKYYDHSKTSFIEKPIQVTARRIVINVESDAVEQERYQLIKKIEQELKENVDLFAQLAQKHSDDKDTASSGGLMKPFAKGEHDQQFERIAFLLPKDGAISNIFKSDKGFEIIQRVSKSAPQYIPFAVAKGDIKKRLQTDMFKKKFTADVVLLSKKPTPEKLEVFLQKHGMHKKHEIPLSEQSNNAQVKALFELKEGEVSSVVDQNTGFLVQLNAVQKPYLPALNDIRDVVVHDMYVEQAIKKQQEQVTLVRKKAATVPLDDLKKEYNLTLKQTSMVSLSNEKEAEKLNDFGVPVPYFAALEIVGGMLEYADDQHAYLIRLDEIQGIDEAAFKEQEASLKGDLSKEEMRRYVEGFVASLHRNATINRNESIIAKLKDHAS